jgi:hypothetical protein
MKKMIIATRGKVFTLKKLDKMIKHTELKRCESKPCSAGSVKSRNVKFERKVNNPLSPLINVTQSVVSVPDCQIVILLKQLDE